MTAPTAERAAARALYSANTGMVNLWAHRLARRASSRLGRPVDPEELLGPLYEVFAAACRGWEPTKGRLTTRFWAARPWKILEAFCRGERLDEDVRARCGRRALDLWGVDDPALGSAPSAASRAEDAEAEAGIWAWAERRLRPRELAVLRERYLDGRTFAESAAAMGVSPQRVEQLHASALLRLARDDDPAVRGLATAIGDVLVARLVRRSRGAARDERSAREALRLPRSPR